MSIQVRVLARNAMAQLAQIQGQLGRLNATSGAGAAGAAAIAERGIPALTKWGSQVQWAGRQLQYNFTVPLALAAGMATKFALDNEKALVRVRKVYGDTSMSQKQVTNETNALAKAFTALSSEFGVNQAEVINVAADWAAAGASGVALAKSTKLTLQTMVLGELDAVTATKSLIAIQAQYGLSTDQLSKTIDVLNMVENQTGTSMGDLIEVMSKSAGTARSAGIDVRHLAALTSALVPAAGSAAAAGNGLKTIFSRLLAPTKQASDVMKAMGINTASQNWQALNGVARLEAMAKSFNHLNGAQKVQVATMVAGRYQLNRFDVLMRDITNTNGYYQKSLRSTQSDQANFNQKQRELNAVLDSQPQQFKQLWTMLQNGMSTAIGPLIPLFISLFATLEHGVHAFTDLNPAIQKLILFFLAFIAGVGPVLKLVGSLGTLLGFLARGLHILGAAFAFILSPVGIFVAAIAGVAVFLIAFHDKLGQIWNSIVKTAINAFYALPKGVQSALEAVVNIVDKAAHEVYELFSYLNPFAHHSPSLVESVQRGMAVISAEYGKIGKIGAPFQVAAKSIKDYRLAIINQRGIVNGLSAELKVANSLLGVQSKKLDTLKNGLTSLQARYDAAQTTMQNFAAAPIKGMQAFTDKIFDNSEAQKKIQLQMLQWQQTYGSIDDLNTKLSNLNGEMNTLQGQSEDLRSKGAGSDVLGPLNDQMSALQKAATATQKTIDNSPIDDLQKQLDKLDQAGQILQLQNDIKFDPLEHQIEKLANTTKELTYQQIIDGVTKARNTMNTLTPQINNQNAAIRTQQGVVSDLTNARNVLQKSYDTENNKLKTLTNAYQQLSAAQAGAKTKKSSSDSLLAGGGKGFGDPGGFAKIGREGKAGDQSKDIDDFTKGIQNELTGRLNKLDMFAPIKSAWSNTVKWLDQNVAGPFGQLWSKVKGPVTSFGMDVYTTLKNFFGSSVMRTLFSGVIDGFRTAFGILRDIFKFVGGLLQSVLPYIEKVASAVRGFFVDAWHRVVPEVVRTIKPLLETIRHLWTLIKVLLAPVILSLMAAFKIFSEVVRRTIGPVLTLVVSIMKNVVRIFRGVLEFLNGVFTGNWKKIWQGIKDIFGGLWDGVVAIFEKGWDVIFNFFAGIVSGLRTVGWNILKGLWSGISDAAKWVWGKITGWLRGLLTGIQNFFGIHSPSTVFAEIGKMLIQGLWNGIVAVFKTMWSWIKTAFQNIVNLIKNILAPIKTAWNAIWATVSSIWQRTGKPIFDWISRVIRAVPGVVSSIGTGFRNAWNAIWGFLSSSWKKYGKPIVDTLESVFRGISSVVRSIASPIKTAFKAALDGISSVFSAFRGAFSGAWNGLKSIFREPVSFLINTVINGGIIGGWNWLAGHIPFVGDHLKLGGLHIKGFAKGGILPGYAPGKDVVPAMLSPGEAVLRPEAVRALGHDKIHKLNREAAGHHTAKGGKYQGGRLYFEDGGVLSDINPLNWYHALQKKVSGVISSFHRYDSTDIGKQLSSIPGGILQMFWRSLKAVPAQIGKLAVKAGNAIFDVPSGSVNVGQGHEASVKIGQIRAAQHGWTGGQWDALYRLWTIESGWNYLADNKSSGAYGIPQALPGSKMASAGADWRTNPLTQIDWGLGYIAGRYGSPAAALAFETSHVPYWYKKGTGSAKAGWNVVGDGGPELVNMRQGARVLSTNSMVGQIAKLAAQQTAKQQNLQSAKSTATVAPQSVTNTTHNVTIKNVSLPGITKADDAEDFISNLEIIARSAT